MSVSLKTVVDWCDQRTRRRSVADFKGSANGLQFANRGTVSKIGAAVDATLPAFKAAAEQGVDLLIVHHGMLWRPPLPVVGPAYDKIRFLVEANLAVYSCHLPLDCHPEIGNNALLARKLGLTVVDWFLPYEGTPVAAKIDPEGLTVDELARRMKQLFPTSFRMINAGPKRPAGIGILTGSGQSSLDHLNAAGIDTLLTGELKQDSYGFAMENGLNLLLGGHYATETFGVDALANEAATRFELPKSFIPLDCPL